MPIKVNWDKAQKLIKSLEELSEKPGGTQIHTGNGDFPVTYLNFNDMTGSKYVLTCKIIPIIEGLPLYQAGYHYAFTELLDKGEKMVCPENTTTMEKFECMPCNFFRTERGMKLTELAWAILKWRKEDPHGFKKLYGEKGCKDLSDKIRPIIKGPVKRFSYLFVAPMPFEDRFMILRLMEDDLPVFTNAFSQNVEKGDALVDINGYSCRLTWARDGDSKYFNLAKVEFGNKKSNLLKDEEKAKTIDTFLENLNAFERMGIELIDKDQGRKLVMTWLKIMEGQLKLYKLVYDKEKKDYTIPSNGEKQPEDNFGGSLDEPGNLPEESGNKTEAPDKPEEPIPSDDGEFSEDLPEESGNISSLPDVETGDAGSEPEEKGNDPETSDDMPVIGKEEFDEVLKDLGAET